MKKLASVCEQKKLGAIFRTGNGDRSHCDDLPKFPTTKAPKQRRHDQT